MSNKYLQRFHPPAQHSKGIFKPNLLDVHYEPSFQIGRSTTCVGSYSQCMELKDRYAQQLANPKIEHETIWPAFVLVAAIVLFFVYIRRNSEL